MKTKWLLLFTVTLVNLSLQQQDIVNELPSYPYQGRMFSGYLNLQNKNKKLHYLFIESERNPQTDPLVLWLNGGPGCSSMLGWAQEHGPAVLPDNSDKFELNPYSWHKVSNIIYLESPAGVGYSYIDTNRTSEHYVDDYTSGEDNLEAVLDFLSKFVNYRNNDFYIAGESYAGIYVPTLASKILDYNSKVMSTMRINLKGILVGNGVTDWKVDTEAAAIEFGFTHGLYNIELREKYLKDCVSNQNADECQDDQSTIQNLLSQVNVYDIYRNCESSKGRMLTASTKSFNYTPWLFKNLKNKINKAKLNFLNYLEGSDEDNLKDSPPCLDTVAAEAYLNREDVKAALYVKDDIKWEVCSSDVEKNYHMDLEKGSIYLYPKLISSGLRILVYSGDTDLAVPYNGTQKWITNLKLPVISSWRSWRANDSNNVAGYITKYDGLTFVTVKGVGHMVPQWKRKEAFHMYSNFLEGKDL